MNLTIYGIKNCSTMKKAFDWLAEHGVEYHFHDYRKAGIAADTLARWCAQAGHEALVNTRGSTWRKLDEAQRNIDSQDDAIALMQAHPSLIRRPVLDDGRGNLLIGFNATRYDLLLDADAGQHKDHGEPA